MTDAQLQEANGVRSKIITIVSNKNFAVSAATKNNHCTAQMVFLLLLHPSTPVIHQAVIVHLTDSEKYRKDEERLGAGGVCLFCS